MKLTCALSLPATAVTTVGGAGGALSEKTSSSTLDGVGPVVGQDHATGIGRVWDPAAAEVLTSSRRPSHSRGHCDSGCGVAPEMSVHS